jgi:23S rRNA (cytidine2498-2'-O)-methyltransferase
MSEHVQEKHRQLLPAPVERGDFLLMACQPGAEAALVARQELVLPTLRKGAWRKGVVTFRLGDTVAGRPFDPPDDFFPDVVFARACLRSLGQVTGDAPETLAAAAAARAGPGPWDRVHVWDRLPPRPSAAAGASATPAAAIARAAVVEQALRAALSVTADDPVARPGDLVLDVCLDAVCLDAGRETRGAAGGESDRSPEGVAERAWIGWHRAATPASTWPGGFYPHTLPDGKVSRAWLKLDEAIASFGLTLDRGAKAVELGCAPGGACQRLLEAGLDVTGVDPAAVDERIVGHPQFTQWRMRARDVKLRAFRGFDWLVADMNIDPTSTLESIGRVATAPGVRLRGIIATLKLPTWERAAELPDWLAAFRGWGFSPEARQLSTAGREVCVVGLRGAR